VHPFRGGALLFRSRQLMLHVDALDDQYPIVTGLYFSAHFSIELAVGHDFARCQRAPEGSQQSTGSSSDHIIDGRGMRLS